MSAARSVGEIAIECAAQSGTFRGAGSNCSSQCPQPAGACCFSSGFCIGTLTQTECTGAGGVWQGALTTCGVGQCTQPCYANCDASTASPILNRPAYALKKQVRRRFSERERPVHRIGADTTLSSCTR